MKNKVLILMHVNTLLSAISSFVVLFRLCGVSFFAESPTCFIISLVYISLNVLFSPLIYIFYKKKKTREMVGFTGHISLFFSYLFFAITICSIVAFCSSLDFRYGAIPFSISLFLLLLSLVLFGSALSITISTFRDVKKQKNIQETTLELK